MPPQLRDVFTPGGLPSVTYVSRDHLELENKIRDALARGYSFNVVTGPTKSGKTVLCLRVLTDKNPIVVEGGQIRSESDFWDHIAYQLNIASSATKERTSESALKATGEAGGSFFGLAQAKTGLEQTNSDIRGSSLTYNNVQILAAIDRLIESKRALLVDDFHYIEPALQKIIIRSLKAAVFKGVPVFLLAVPHRAFDPLTVENEVEGRFKHIPIPRWSADDLLEIPRLGFPALNVTVDRSVQRQICDDAFGNPLLVQEICTELCLKNGLRERQENAREMTGEMLETVYKEMAESKGFPSYQRLTARPKGGATPEMLPMNGGGTEQINTAVIASIARLGPKTETKLADISASLRALVASDEEMPSIERLMDVLIEISRVAKETATGEPPLEWMDRDDRLVIIDPFLLFYLKWTYRNQRQLRATP